MPRPKSDDSTMAKFPPEEPYVMISQDVPRQLVFMTIITLTELVLTVASLMSHCLLVDRAERCSMYWFTKHEQAEPISHKQ